MGVGLSLTHFRPFGTKAIGPPVAYAFGARVRGQQMVFYVGVNVLDVLSMVLGTRCSYSYSGLDCLT